MVRLKLYNRWNTILYRIPSQFHYGSIKTDFLALCTQIARSLNSTMVRLKLKWKNDIRGLKTGLNSTMVRLKLVWAPPQQSGKSCLNSTMVRLKRGQLEKEVMLNWSLNSTMVRLKQTNKRSCWNRNLRLNSTMVRLKPIKLLNNSLKVSWASQFHYGSIKT